MRRPSRRTSCVDIILCGMIFLLVWTNLFITLSMFASDAFDAKSASIGTPSTSSGSNMHNSSSALPSSASSDGQPPPQEQPIAQPRPTPSLESRLASGDGPYRAQDIAYPFFDLDEFVQNTVRKKFWGPTIFPVSDQEPGLLDIETLQVNPYAAQREEDPAEAYRRHNDLLRDTGCNLLTVPFIPSQDAACLSYLQDTQNWDELRPIEPEYDSRTIKFELRFKERPVPNGSIATGSLPLRVVMKIPQKLFPLEPFAEVGAFHADRVLRVNRVPPTGWVCMPNSMIHASLAKYGSSIRVADPEHSGSETNYTKWVEEDVFHYVQRDRRYGGKDCVYMSIQLRVADAAHLLDSVLRIPYIPHDEGWFKYLDLQNKVSDKGAPLFKGQHWAATIVHLAELIMFDYIIGNGDRSPNKNNFVVGGCDDRECGNQKQDKYYLRRPGPPTFVHLDQGMAFYGLPRRNPLGNSVAAFQKDNNAPDSFCLFRSRFLNRVILLHQSPEPEAHPETSRFEMLMQERLPQGVETILTTHVLRKCHDRMTSVLHLAQRCESRTQGRVRDFVFAP